MFRYNTALCQTRRFVENVIGWWKRKFHSLHSELRIDLQYVPQYIMASAVLHNISRIHNLQENAQFFEHPHLLPNNFQTGDQMRNHIVQTYYDQ